MECKKVSVAIALILLATFVASQVVAVILLIVVVFLEEGLYQRLGLEKRR